MDGGMDDDEERATQEKEIFEKLRLHKEVLGAAKHQPWPLKKKVKLVKQAKSYIRRHEGALQERLAQSRTTKDVLAQASIFINNVRNFYPLSQFIKSLNHTFPGKNIFSKFSLNLSKIIKYSKKLRQQFSAISIRIVYFDTSARLWRFVISVMISA